MTASAMRTAGDADRPMAVYSTGSCTCVSHQMHNVFGRATLGEALFDRPWASNRTHRILFRSVVPVTVV